MQQDEFYPNDTM